MKFEIEQYHFPDDGTIPNSKLPVLIYRKVATQENNSDWLEETFAKNGWTNNWRDTILTYDHFHSTTHEVLGVGRGEVMLRIGGKAGEVLKVSAGDVIVLPAGVGHASLPGQGDYEIVGGYPEGRDWDLLTGTEEERKEALPRIANLPLPENDPITGTGRPLLEAWGLGPTKSL